MVIRLNRASQQASLMTELVIALGILVLAMIPMSFAFMQERKLCRAYYYKAAAMEIIDGEMEILVAGEWRSFKAGTQTYTVRADSATNLPPGAFQLTLSDHRARLEWIPQGHGRGGAVTREVTLK
jgi:hypothetical protein